MTSKSVLALCVLLSAIGTVGQQAAPPSPADIAARNEIELVEKLLPQLPDRAPALFVLAHDYATLGDQQKALSLLRECLSLHEGFDPEREPEFEGLKSAPEFRSLVQQVHREFPPVNRARLAFTIADEGLIPEGLAADTAGDFFYMGSLAEKKIVKIATGVATDFVPTGKYGIHSICGLKVDPKNRDVWANVCRDSGRDAELLHFNAHGKLLERFAPTTQGPHLFNDLVLRNAKEIFLTDSLAQQAFRFDRTSDTFHALILPRPLYYPNGIALSEDGNRLYIADAFGVLQYDLRSGKGNEVQSGPSSTLSGIDGMYWYRGGLIGIQNSLGMPRVARFELDPAGLKVTKTTVLEYRSDFVELPTTGAIEGSDFYFMANTQVDHWKNARVVDPKMLTPVRVAVVSLD
jgi:hypothetical protein